MDKRFDPSDSVIDGLHSWKWYSCDSEVLCEDLVRAVADAERVAGDVSDPRRLSVRRLSYWQWALALAEEVCRREPAPHPTAVEDALARVEEAAERLNLRPAGAH
jgi:hypothetical protein